MGTSLDCSQPLAQGLLWYSAYPEAGGNPVEVVRRRAQTGGTWVSTPGGWGFQNGSVSNASTPDLGFTAGPFSVACYAYLSAAPPSNQYPVLFQRQQYTSEISNSGWSLHVRPTSDTFNGWSFTLLNNNGVTAYTLCATTPAPAAGLWLLVGTFDAASTRNLYVNGALAATRASSTGLLATSAATQIGLPATGVNSYALMTAAWNRAITANEVQQLSLNPLCLYAPARRVWVMPRTQSIALAAATLSPLGGLGRTPSHVSAGSSTPSGTISRTPAHHEAGASTPAGTIARTPAHQEAGSSTAAGTFTRTPGHQEAGAARATGSLARAPAHQESGSSTPAGALGRTPQAGLSGALAAGGGILGRSIAAAGEAALASSGALARALGGTYDATLAATGDLARTLRASVAATSLVLAGALSNVARVARDATFDLAGAFTGGALHRLYTLLLDASLDLAGLLAKASARHDAGTLAPDGGLMRTAALVREGTVALRGRYVGIFRVVRRAALALAARAARLLAPLRAHRVGLLSRLHAVAPLVPARPTAIALPARARTLRLSPERTVPMQLVADDPDAPLVIAPLERNVAFTADFGADIPSGRQIASVATQVVRLDDPSATDLSPDFVAAATLTSGHTGVEVIVGNGAQQARATYRVRIIATLDNTPPTDLVGYFDLPCRE